VALALDESGSMGHHDRIGIAARLAAGIATTLERARIPVEVVGYSSQGSSSHRTIRTNPAVYNVIKSFEEPRLAAYKCVPHLGGNNSDPDVLRLLGERLLARREPKKVLLFLSDGEPLNGSVSSASKKAFTRELRLLESKGVIVFGFGMEANLGEYFTNPNNHVTVDAGHLKDLPRIMLKKLESILL
jgi:cobalamin biosynthesis protein CobT